MANLLGDPARAKGGVLELAVVLQNRDKLMLVGIGGIDRRGRLFAELLGDVPIILKVEVSVDAQIDLVVDIGSFALGVANLLYFGSHDGASCRVSSRLCSGFVRMNPRAQTTTTQNSSQQVNAFRCGVLWEDGHRWGQVAWSGDGLAVCNGEVTYG